MSQSPQGSISNGRVLEHTLLSYFEIFHSRNMVRRDCLFPLVDALMDHETRNIKKELDERMKQIKTSRRTSFHCPSCACVFENPVTLTCGHTICQECLQRKSELIRGERPEGNLTFCLLCGTNLFNERPLVVNIILSDLIKKRFPEGEKLAEARIRGKSQLLTHSPQKAVETFSVALDTSPKDYECLCLRSDAFLKLKLFYLALRDANNACKLRPDLPEAFHRKAKILTKLKSWDDAVLQFLRCAALDPARTRRDELTERLFNLFTSTDVTKLDQKVIARKIASIAVVEEPQKEETDLDSTDTSSEEGSNDEQETAKSSYEEKVVIDVAGLKCYLCGLLLLYPVTIQCGHTFCMECIKESLEYGPTCPRCQAILIDSKVNRRNITVVLDELLKLHLEKQFRERKELHSKKVELWKRVGIDQNVEIPILVGTVAIPQGRIRLALSHPCHRVMVRRAVEWGSRMFGMCSPDEGKGFTDHGAIVEIQATESFPGGKLIVQVIPKQRFRVVSRSVTDGCPVAKVKWLEDAKIDDCEAILHLKWRNSLSHLMLKRWLAALPLDEKACIENALGPMPPCDSHLLLSPNGPPWLWWSMAAIPLPANEKLRLLQMPRTADRLQSIQNYLNALLKSLSRDRKQSDAKEQSTNGCHPWTSFKLSLQKGTVTSQN